MSNFDSLEAISQCTEMRALFLRLSRLAQEGRVDSFLVELASSEGIDGETKAAVAELASDPSFLLVVEDYLYRTSVVQ